MRVAKTLLLCALALTVAAWPAVSAAQMTNEGPVAVQAQDPLAAQNRASFAEDLLLKFADQAAARGHDAYWDKGRRLLSRLDGGDLLALDAVRDYDTFYKRVFLGYIPSALGDTQADLVYYPLSPCRLYDSRTATAAGLGGPMAPNTTRAISVNDSLTAQGGNPAGCGAGLTNDPPALMITITSVNSTGPGNLRTFATGDPIPVAATLVYNTGLLTSTGTITPSCIACSEELSIRNQGSGNTDVVVDVAGYFTRATFGPANGVVRAAAHITAGATPSVTRSFNLAGTPVTVSRPGTGIYLVDFGTNVSTRFYNVVAGNAASGNPGASFATVTPSIASVNALFIEVFNNAGTLVDESFFVQVF